MDRPVVEVLAMAEQAVRLVTGEQVEAMNREWAAEGNPEPVEASEVEVRSLFPEVS